jgi:quercetin dioxygenase-like cupin family protein
LYRVWESTVAALLRPEGSAAMKLHHWNEIEREQLGPLTARQVVNSDRLTIARIYLKKGAVVARHQHENEQVSYLLEGHLRFQFDTEEVIVGAGEMMQIESQRPHLVEALEDSVALDIFQPVREDWLRGEDSYLRNPPGTP